MQKNMTFNTLTRCLGLAAAPLALCVSLTLAQPIQAQGLFSPAATVNEDVVSVYELEQRIILMELMRSPGNPSETALTELINDKLRLAAAREAGIEISPEDIQGGIENFAARSNLEPEEFLKAIGEGGVSPETFRDFVEAGLAWRELVSARFLSRARPTAEEIDRALGQTGGYTVQVLLSELIMPVTPDNFQQVQAIADEAAQIDSYEAFSAAATQFSAADSRFNGGRLDWLTLSNLPPNIRATLLALKPGEVSEPIQLQNALALFQMRGIREAKVGNPRYAAIEFAEFYIPGGRTPEALSAAQSIRNSVDTCDDLYGIAKDQPESLLERKSLAPSEIPSDVSIELAKLDPGEVSTNLTRNNGQVLVFLMLCGRTGAISEDTTREEIADALTQQRLSAFSESYLQQLRADALIVEK
ncbi:MAG: peptidylprolyl isomerase [Rhodobacteraceae bacterium]|nr:peptidylprolyl isomerase [Paracoccaceae bacterium]